MPEHTAPPIVVSPPAGAHPDARDIEVVERKGRGHPDSICDALAEAFSIGLTRAYHERFGAILHHNVDKVLLVGGSSTPSVGGGEVTTPIDVYLAGRATGEVAGTVIPVAAIAEATARAWLRANLHALDAERHVRIHPLVRPGAAELRALMSCAPGSAALSNDTSLAIGHAPPSRLERIVLAVEQALTAPSTIALHPVIGEDVKVMGVRRGRRIDLTIACAMVDRHVRRLADYVAARETVARLAEHAAAEAGSDLHVAVNAADDIESGRLYLTVTGTSAEAGDDGEVGRGNRVGGLITPGRPMTLEAAAGKNVVSHVGKSYSIVAHRMARALVAKCPDVAAATCVIVSRIGWPVDRPQVVELQIETRRGVAPDALREPAEAIARECLRGVTGLAGLLLDTASVESPAAWPGILLF